MNITVGQIYANIRQISLIISLLAMFISFLIIHNRRIRKIPSPPYISHHIVSGRKEIVYLWRVRRFLTKMKNYPAVIHNRLKLRSSKTGLRIDIH